MHIDDEDDTPNANADYGDDFGINEKDDDIEGKEGGEGADKGEEGEDSDADKERDEKGRFKAKDKDAKGKDGEEEEEEDDADADADADDDADEGKPKEGEEEEEDDDDDADPKKQNFPIRINRMREQRDRERARAEAAERRLQELTAAGKKPDAPADPIAPLNAKLDQLYEEVEQARLDADPKTAAKLQREIDSINREIGKIEARTVASTTTTQAQLNAQYDLMVDTIEATFDELNPESDDFDPGMAQQLEFQVKAHEAAGMTPPAALRRAVTLLFRVDPWGKKPKAKDKVEDEPKKPDAKKPDVKKALDTVKRQPPDASTKGVNKDSTKVDGSKLTDEEWDALPESQKAKLRGDWYGLDRA